MQSLRSGSSFTAEGAWQGRRLIIPDVWQQEGVRMLREGMDVVVDAPTGAGKTKIFEWWIESGGTKGGQVVFTVPTRALANDKFMEWQQRGWRVGLATGDRTIRSEAPILVATLETQRERLLSGSPPVFLAVDEYQLLGHPTRGRHYETLIALAPPATQLLFLSGSVADPQRMVEWLSRIGRNAVLIRETHRPVPLEEIPVERLPMPGGKSSGFWARFAQGALRANLTPCLLFAPRRADAEKIAASLAAALTPRPDLVLDDSRLLRCDRRTVLWLRRGLAVHHSGLPSHIRAEIIEPMAKAGRLDFIVATTGLAAGINFSVRSVLVTGTRYQDGPVQRELRPDELLQMMGRAGRRGIDEIGTILSLRNCPGLGDAAPGNLRPPRQLDWACALRLMERSAEPVADVMQFAARLMAPPQHFEEKESEITDAGSTQRALQSGRTWVKQLLSSKNEWLPSDQFVETLHPLSRCIVHQKGSWRAAESVADEALYPGAGRICRLSRPGEKRRYGREEIIAAKLRSGNYRLVQAVAKLAGVPPRQEFSFEEIRELVIPTISARQAQIRRTFSIIERNGRVVVRWEYAEGLRKAFCDPHGRILLSPPERIVFPQPDVEIELRGETFVPSRRSELRAWRELGLIDRAGHPTVRGSVFARFQGGEGLLVAAALEEENYPPQELLRDLANLRGSHRFAELPPQGSERLAAAARARFGHRNIPGLLHEGLCIGYGENTREALELCQRDGIEAVRKFCPEVGQGDIERARLEWLSVLRHITRVPPPGLSFWPVLVHEASQLLHQEGVA